MIAKRLFEEGAIVYAGVIFSKSIDQLNEEFKKDPRMKPIMVRIIPFFILIKVKFVYILYE